MSERRRRRARVLVVLSTLSVTLLAGLVACTPDERTSTTRLERMEALASTHHPLSPEELSRLDDEDLASLRHLAEDDQRPLWLRLRALGLASARPNEETRALWRRLRSAPERELRWQAAWAEGLSRDGKERLAFAALLLEDHDEALREAAAHLLGTISKGMRQKAVALALERAKREPNPTVRAALERNQMRR